MSGVESYSSWRKESSHKSSEADSKIPKRKIIRGKTSEDTVGESNLIVILRNLKKEN